jgi:hypothetical protein
MEYKMDNITNYYTTLTNFKNINSKNGNYISNKVFGSKNVTKKLKIQASLVINKKIKKKWGNVLKEIHKFRVTNLNNIQNTECGAISDKLKSININSNKYFNFEVQNDEELNNRLKNLLKNYTDEDINKFITSEFSEEKKSDKIENKDLIIDTNKLKKIAEDDFAIALKKIIAKVEDPKAIKYLYNFIDKLGEQKLGKHKVSNKIINEIKKALANKTHELIITLLATASNNNQKIEDFHALLTICSSYDIEISNSKKKKILDSCMHCFDVIATQLNDNSYDYNTIKQQYEALANFRLGVVNNIIKYTATKSDKKISETKNKLSFVKKWTDLTLNKHKKLVEDLKNNRKQIIDISNNIKTLINEGSNLSSRIKLIDDRLNKDKQTSADDSLKSKNTYIPLTEEQINVMEQTKEELDAKYQQLVSETNNTWDQLNGLLFDGKKKQDELKQHIDQYDSIPKNELLERDYNHIEEINNFLQQQIDAKIADFPDSYMVTQLVNQLKTILDTNYIATVSLTLINSIVENATKTDDFITYFTNQVNYYAQVNSENNSHTSYTPEAPVNETNQLQSEEPSELNQTIEDPIYMNVDTINASNSFAFSPVSQAPRPPSIASATQNNNIPTDKPQVSNRQNLLKDIRNPDQINRLKKVSRNNTSENNKVEPSSSNENILENSSAFKKAKAIIEENGLNENNATDNSEWD